MIREDDAGENIDDGIFEAAMSAYKEVSAKTPEAPPPEIKADVTEAEVVEPDKEADKTADDKGRVRGPDGKFTKTADTKPETDKVITDPSKKVVVEKAPENKQATPDSPTGGPPPSWSIKAKAQWEKLPAEIRADVLKREGEVSQGLVALRDYKDLKPWADKAAQHGTTIGKALERYTGLESMLRQNLPQGLAVIATNAGLDQGRAAHLFAQMAQQLSGGRITMASGGQPNAGQQTADPLVEAMRPLLGPLMQEIDGLKGKLSSRDVADRNAQSQSLAKAIEEFGSDPVNRFFPDLEDSITQLFETGMVKLTSNYKADLKTAYDLAARMNPQVSEALIEQRLEETRAADRKKEQEAADKARNASRSLTGSRVPGARVIERDDQKADGYDDIEDDVRKAFRVHASR